MSFAVVLLKELRHRWLNAMAGVVAVVAAVGLFVALLTLEKGAEDETRRLMRDMGFNLLIVPKGTNMSRFWSTDFVDKDMPEEYVYRLARSRRLSTLSADHFVGTLSKRIRWRGRMVLLKGVRKEEGKKSPMGFSRALGPKHEMIPRGKAYLGYELWAPEGLSAGDVIQVLGKKLEVAYCMFESGSKEDITLFANLHDVQAMLHKPGRVNTIEALHCLCAGASLSVLRKQIAEVLPGAEVSEIRAIAQARSRIRRNMHRYGAAVVQVVLVVCALWVGVLSFLNVRERETEIGLLRALGRGAAYIMGLFLGRAAALGVTGAGIGFAAGTVLALRTGPTLFRITYAHLQPDYGLLKGALVLAPLVAVAVSFVPTMMAVTEDPAVTLVKE